MSTRRCTSPGSPPLEEGAVDEHEGRLCELHGLDVLVGRVYGLVVLGALRAERVEELGVGPEHALDGLHRDAARGRTLDHREDLERRPVAAVAPNVVEHLCNEPGDVGTRALLGSALTRLVADGVSRFGLGCVEEDADAHGDVLPDQRRKVRQDVHGLVVRGVHDEDDVEQVLCDVVELPRPDGLEEGVDAAGEVRVLGVALEVVHVHDVRAGSETL